MTCFVCIHEGRLFEDSSDDVKWEVDDYDRFHLASMEENLERDPISKVMLDQNSSRWAHREKPKEEDESSFHYPIMKGAPFLNEYQPFKCIYGSEDSSEDEEPDDEDEEPVLVSRENTLFARLWIENSHRLFYFFVLSWRSSKSVL